MVVCSMYLSPHPLEWKWEACFDSKRNFIFFHFQIFLGGNRLLVKKENKQEQAGAELCQAQSCCVGDENKS